MTRQPTVFADESTIRVGQVETVGIFVITVSLNNEPSGTLLPFLYAFLIDIDCCVK
jgi:hypothetical protein